MQSQQGKLWRDARHKIEVSWGYIKNYKFDHHRERLFLGVLYVLYGEFIFIV